MKQLSTIVPRFIAVAFAIATALAAAPAQASCTPPPAGIIAWWQAESNALDIIGGNNGSVPAGVTFGPGEVGQAFNFAGNANITVPNQPTLNPTNQLTVECWIYPRARAAFTWPQDVVTKDGECVNRQYILGIDNNNSQGTGAGIFESTVWLGSGAVPVSGATVVQTNTWYHVAVTYDGALLKLYVNGAVDGQVAVTGPIVTGSEPVRLGGGAPSGCTPYFFNGMLDEPAIYNRALASNEIAAIYLAGSAGKCTPAATGPVITFQPTNLTVVAGSTATFSVTATGTAPLAYQWSLNNTNLPGATNATLLVPNVQLSQNGSFYSVLVSNPANFVVSSNAFLTVSSPAPPPSCTPPPAGIVGWWPAENNVTDIIGGDNGVLSASGATFAAGEVGKGFRLDGTNGYVQIPDSAALRPTNVTVEAWVWLDPAVTGSAGEYIIFKRNTRTSLYEGYSLAQYMGHFQFSATRNGNQVSANSTTVIQRGTWYHVAGTYDVNTLTVYVNGVAEASAVAGFALDYDTLPVYFGTSGEPAPNRGMLTGVIDEPSIYNRALASNEIAAIYLAGAAGKCTSVPVASAVPAIYNFAPAAGFNGTVVTLSGTNFSSTLAANIVYFGAVRATVTAASPASLTVTVPTGATYAPITVTVGGLQACSSQSFEPTYAGSGSNITTSSFAPSFNLSTPGGPGQTVIADLDGDGKPDVIVADVYNNTISIFRNISTNGTLSANSFAPPVNLPATAGSYSPSVIAVADVDGDGKLDIIATESGDNLVSVYRNTSTPGNLSSNSFAARVDFPTGVQPQGVVVRDLDGDGRPDMVVPNSGDGTVSLLQNIGAPGTLTTYSFAPKIDIATGAGADRVAVGDLNGDGRPDLAVANGNAGTVSVLQNIITSPGSFTAGSFAPKIDLAVPSGAIQVTILDVDGDGKPDLAVTAYLPQTFSLIQNLSTGGNLTSNSFAPRIDYPLNGRGHTIAVGDINGDGKPDLIVDTELNSLLNIFQNVSTPGTLNNNSLASQVELATGWNAWGVSVGDLDGDGRPDLIFANSYDSTLQIYQNQMPFATPPPPPPACTPVPAGIVGWWQGEGNPNDLISSNNATLFGGATYAAGEVGQGFRLDGTNGYVQIPDSAALKPANVTVEAWVWLDPAINTTTNQRTECIIFKKNSWDFLFEGYELVKESLPNGDGTYTDHFSFVITSSGNQIITHSTTAVQRGKWYHVAGTYDGTTQTLVVNGVAEASAYAGFALDYGTRPVFLGTSGQPAPYQSMFAGIIDEASIYNRALTTNELAAIYLAGSAGKCYSPVAPMITAQPTNLTVTVNNTAVFNVTAQGTSPLYYQWSYNGTNILGATNSSLTLNNISPAFAGNYSVLVSNFVGTVTSSNATLTVLVPAVPPSILAQTPSQIVLLGSAATFTVTAGGSAPLSYFWERNNVPIPGATNASYTLPGAQLADSGSKFSCLVTNAYGFAASTNATLKVIDTVSNDLCSGAVVITSYSYTNVQSTVKASSYGDPLPDCIDGFGNGVWYQFTPPVSGLLLADTLGSDFDTGLAVYTGSCGSFTEVACNDDYDGVTSALSLPTTAGTTYYLLIGGYDGHVGNLVFHLNYQTPPAFDVQPTNISVVVSSNATFTTAISGTQPISAQWYFNNTPLVDGGRISGSTNPVLNIVNVNPNDGGNYFIIASNFLGVTTSSVAVLTPVILPPVILVPPVSQSIVTGANVTFTTVVYGTPPYTYQWSLNGNPLADDGVRIFGSSTGSLTVSNLTTADAGSYSLTATNVSGSASASATLVVMVPPVITVPPVGRSVPPGLPTIFNASVAGIPTPVYQWQLSGTNLPGATGSSYTNPAVGINDLGYYQVIASNVVGSVTSSVAQLTFGPVAAWGRNLNNECLPPPGLSNVVGVAGVNMASIAIHGDGSLAFWGGNSGTNAPASATNVVQLALTGGTGNYALRSDGTVVGWTGYPPPVLSNVVSVAAGNLFALALRTEGTVVGWGSGAASVVPAGLSRVVAISCGNTHSLALRSNGTVVTWGSGTGTNLPPGISNIVAIAAGFTHSLALRANGTVVAWGSGTGTNVPAGLTNVTAISTATMPYQSLDLALRANGTVVAWGDISFGETNPPAALSNLLSVAIAAVPNHGLALVNDGSPQILQPPVGLTAYTGRDVTFRGTAVGAAPLAYQWLLNGTNIPNATNTSLILSNIQLANAGNYQLLVSNSINTALSLPAPVTVISNSAPFFLSQTTVSATNIYQAGRVTFNSGTVLGSGPLRYQWFFSATNRNYVPVPAATNDTLTFDPALAVQTGNYYIAISNLVGGVTSAPVGIRVLFARAWGYQAVSNPPVNVTNCIALATGGGSASLNGHYLALGSDGKVTAWSSGSTFYGETNVSALSNSIVTAIAAGYQESLALKSDGTVYAWGYGGYGQTNPPVGLSGVTAISVGGYHDLALKADGTVVGWGDVLQAPNYGQATNNPAATNVVAIAAGQQHSLALRADGSVVAWGYGSDGSTLIPFGATNIVAIAAGNGFSAALRANGTVVEWGGLGNYPVPLNLSNVVAISGSGTHLTALKNDGTVVTWGYQYAGLASNNLPADLTNVVGLASGGDHDIALFGTRAPVFTVQPWNRAVIVSKSAYTTITLAAKCAGVQPVRYQWLLNGTNYPNATNDTLTLRNDGLGGPGQFPAGAYQLVASNAYGVTFSKPAKVTIVIPLGEAVDATNLVWTSTGSTPWYGQTNITHDGLDAARSGGIGGSQETILQTTLATNFSGFATFWWKVSSEQFFDTLEFRVNGTVQATISGEVDWTQASIPIPAGTNLLQWRYSKDASFDSGLDAGFVDQFAFVAGPPIITNQPNSVVVNAGANVTLSVAAVGAPQLKYQWWKDGNAVGGNSPVLAMNNVSRANAGNYCVTVTNLAGSVTSSTAAVRVVAPQLLGSPQLLPDGSLQLIATDANGGTLTDADLPNFEAQASSDLVNWTTLPDALSLTNGRLQLQDTSRTNFTTRFYRIIEHPAP
ncbi:MAG: immunoglobulin domain-containing protein [Verrucomicrobiae bacterium]|nr:immunoglobulin domain-containing protein [Verrucomicrobiae bacterium]